MGTRSFELIESTPRKQLGKSSKNAIFPASEIAKTSEFSMVLTHDDAAENQSICLAKENKAQLLAPPPQSDYPLAQTNDMAYLAKFLSEIKPFQILTPRGATDAASTREGGSKNEGKAEGEEVYYENQVPERIRFFSERGFENLISNNPAEALVNFRKSELLINALLTRKKSQSQENILFCLINLGVAYANVGLLGESLSCFNDSLICFKNIYRAMKNEKEGRFPANFGRRLRFKRLQEKVLLQSCLIASEIGRHSEGLEYSKQAFKIAYKQIINSLSVCYHRVVKPKLSHERNNIFPRANSGISSMHKHLSFSMTSFRELKEPAPDPVINLSTGNGELDRELDYVERLIPILKAFMENLSEVKDSLAIPTGNREITLSMVQKNLKNIGACEANMQIILDALDPTNQGLESSILSLAQIKPVSLEFITSEISIESQLEPMNILEKFMEVTIALYCCATEVRFLEETEREKSNQCLMENSEKWLSKSLELAFTFIPHEIPFVSQILTIYKKFHDLNMQQIHEDESIEYNFKYLKPIKGIAKELPFIPIVKKEPRKVTEVNPEKISTLAPSTSNPKTRRLRIVSSSRQKSPQAQETSPAERRSLDLRKLPRPDSLKGIAQCSSPNWFDKANVVPQRVTPQAREETKGPVSPAAAGNIYILDEAGFGWPIETSSKRGPLIERRRNSNEFFVAASSPNTLKKIRKLNLKKTDSKKINLANCGGSLPSLNVNSTKSNSEKTEEDHEFEESPESIRRAVNKKGKANIFSSLDSSSGSCEAFTKINYSQMLSNTKPAGANFLAGRKGNLRMKYQKTNLSIENPSCLLNISSRPLENLFLTGSQNGKKNEAMSKSSNAHALEQVSPPGKKLQDILNFKTKVLNRKNKFISNLTTSSPKILESNKENRAQNTSLKKDLLRFVERKR